ncbi:MAG: M16 family metallopeptidase [Candidatus Acidiferrales bacterium]
MKALKLIAAVVLFASCAYAQKEAPLPKELPPYGPEQPLQAPAVKIAKLDNGLTIWLVSEPGFPKVSFAVAVRGGMAADPAGLPGISELLSNTLAEGTKSRSARQIAEELQAAGGDINTQAGKDFTEVSTSALSSRTDAALTVLADILLNASFPDNEVALAKRNLSDSLRQRESRPQFLAARTLADVLFGENPYHVTSPTQESIAAATPADLRRVFAQRFRPDQAIFVAVGDFENDKMLDMLKANFGGWKAPAESPIAAPTPPSTTPAHAVFVVARPGSVQTTLRFGAFGPLRTDPDYEAADVANAIYGGLFSSRLVTNIREDKGYTYSPGSNLQTYRAAAVLGTGADVRNEVTAPSFNEITYEMNRMATTSPTEEELAKAKHFLIGIQAIFLQARDAVASQLADFWVDGLPPEEIEIYGKKIENTTSAEVDAAARKYFPASRTVVVAVGEEKVIREAFAPFGLPIQTVH